MALRTATILLFAGVASALVVEANFDKSDFAIVETPAGFRVELRGGTTPQDGSPWIEFTQKLVLLPPGRRAVGVKLIGDVAETVAVDGNPAPVCGAAMDKSAKVNAPKAPQSQTEPVSLAATGTIMGFAFAAVRIKPVELSEGRLIIHKRLSFDIETEACKHSFPERATIFSDGVRKRIAKAIFGESPLFDLYRTTITPSCDAERYSFPPLPGDDPADLVVVTSQELLPEAKEMLSETRNGVVTRFFCVEDIVDTYDGCDEAEKLQNFLRDAYENWGIVAALLVGDYTVLPVRYITALDRAGDWSSSTSDVYFAALSGNLNTDYDAYFGEEDADEIYPDIFVSRLEVKNAYELESFSQKHESYRFGHPGWFFGRLLFIGSSISTHGNDDSGALRKNAILAETGLDTIFCVTKMYSHPESTGGDVWVSAENFVEALGEGYALINHFDHGNQAYLSFGMYVGGGGLSMSDVASLENELFPIFYTFSCDVNRMDTDNIARHWTLNPRGGGIGMFAHSNTAWSTQAYMDDFMWLTLVESRPRFSGELLVGWISRLSYHYDISILNYCGHPLTPIAPEPPREYAVSFEPEELSGRDTTISVRISPLPFDTVFVALASRQRLLASRFCTDTTVELGFTLWGEDTVWLVVYGLPVKRFAIPVASCEGGFVCWAGLSELLGDGDGIPEVGEVVRPAVDVVGAGADDTVFVGIPELGVHDEMGFLAPAGDTVELWGEPFELRGELRGASAIEILCCLASGGCDTFSATVAGPSPRLVLAEYVDADSIPAPGDTGVMLFVIQNDRVGNLIDPWLLVSADGAVVAPETTHLDDMTSGGFDSIFVVCFISDSATGLSFSLQLHSAGDTFLWTLSVSRPEPPGSIWVVPYSDRTVLCWEPPASGAAGYVVLRATNPDAVFLPQTPAPITNATYEDRNLPDADEFYYRVRCIDSLGNLGPPSAPVRAWRIFPPLEGFPVDLPIGVWPLSAPAAIDADGDGCKEIYVSDESGNICAFSCDGSELLDTSVGVDPIFSCDAADGLGFWSSIAAADIDGDGETEIVEPDRMYPGRLWVIDPWGDVEPGFPVSLPTRFIATPALADLDDDGLLEIILFGQNRRLYIVRADGAPYAADYLVDSLPECTDGFGPSSPAVGDIDGDGEPEVIVGGGTDDAYNGYIYAWNADGSRVDGFPKAVYGDPRGSPVLGNIDDDTTTAEIITYVYPRGLYAFRGDGTIVPGFPVHDTLLGPSDGIRSPALTDIDGDGRCEIVFQSNERLCVIRPDGSLLPGFPVPVGNPHWSSPLVVDVDGDGELEILAPNDTRLVAYEFGGNAVDFGFPLRGGVALAATPMVEDVDGDGRLEIAAPAFDSRLYVWKTPAASESPAPTWSHFRHDLRRTGCFPQRSPWRADAPATKPKAPRIAIFPNPFNRSCEIAVFAPLGGTIIIKDLLGRAVREFEVGEGRTKLVWRGEDDGGKPLPSGIYFVVLRAPCGSNLARRVALIK